MWVNMSDEKISFRELCNSPACRPESIPYIKECPDCIWDCRPTLSTLTLDEFASIICWKINEWWCVLDVLVSADSEDIKPWTLIDKIKWCEWIDVSVWTEWDDRYIKICYKPSSANIKFTDLIDWPWTYWENCWETECNQTNSDCECQSSTCIWAVLMPKCDGTWVERRCMVQTFIWEIWMDTSKYELTLPPETEWPKVEIAMNNNAELGWIPDWQPVYTNSWISERIVITKEWRYDIDWQVQYAVNKYINAVRFWLYNRTTNTEVIDFKDWGRLNNWRAWLTWYDTSYWRDNPQDVNVFNKNMYMQSMFYTSTINWSEWLEPWEYSIVMKVDTRTDNTGTETWRITILWKNWDTVLSERDPALTYLTIQERAKTYIPLCPQ